MKVSIIITNYNYSKYLARCLRSCMSQVMDIKDFEIIVVDDASTDNSINILNAFRRNVKIIRNKKNIGVAKSVNKAVKIANDITLGLRREKYAPIVPRSASSLNLLGAIFVIYKFISND